MKTPYLGSLLILCIAVSCVVSRQNSNSAGAKPAADDKEQNAQLIFMNFKITRDSIHDNSAIQLTKIRITGGSMKKEKLPSTYKPAWPDALRCVIEDDRGNKIFETTIEHPLYRRFEYPMDDGGFGTKNVVLKEAVFFIRAGYSPEMKFIHIFETLSPSVEEEIARIKIKI